MLRTVCDELAARGHPKAIISCAPDNVASIRGIERAGFARVHHVKTLILLSRLIAKRREEPF